MWTDQLVSETYHFFMKMARFSNELWFICVHEVKVKISVGILSWRNDFYVS